MERFEYANPSTLKEAVGMLSDGWGETEILAGGTDLLSLMKNYVATPKRLVNLKSISELHAIHESNGDIHIGALTTLQELHDHEAIHAEYHSLAHAAGSVSSMQIRNLGTVGGELCQRPRCWYYRNGLGLLADNGKLVTEGDNRYHAILGNSGPAKFVNPSSLAPALIALDARVTIQGPDSVREIPLEQFFRTPKSEDERETSLNPNEIVTFITIPGSSRDLLNATYEVRQREALDWPLATASVALAMEYGKVTKARVVLGHVAPTPWVAAAAAEAITGQGIDERTASKAGMEAVRGARPLSGNAYKVKLASVAVKRALLQAAKGGM